MKQKILILAGLMLLLLGTINCYGFCIYNKTDLLFIDAAQISGGEIVASFRQVIEKGDKKCCSWSEHSCNTEGKKDSILKFLIAYPKEQSHMARDFKKICGKTIKAYQDIIVTGSNGNYQCIVQ